jgi:hypothetical protein
MSAAVDACPSVTLLADAQRLFAEPALHAVVAEGDDAAAAALKQVVDAVTKTTGEMMDCVRKYDTRKSGVTTIIPDDVLAMARAVVASGLLDQLLDAFPRLTFDARHQLASMFTFATRQCKADATAYIQERPHLLQKLVDGHKDGEIAAQCGQLMRDLLRSEELNTIIINTPELINPFFTYCQSKQFDISSDAFNTFQLMLTKHPTISSKFLVDNFEDFFDRFDTLLKSRNYVASWWCECSCDVHLVFSGTLRTQMSQQSICTFTHYRTAGAEVSRRAAAHARQLLRNDEVRHVAEAVGSDDLAGVWQDEGDSVRGVPRVQNLPRQPAQAAGRA